MLPATSFYIIRHGESEANLGQYASGHVDVALTPLGIEQAYEAARKIAALPVKPSIIIHSHLQRARNTAHIINESLGLQTIEDPTIAEQHYGDWEGVSWDITRQGIRDGIDPPKGETHTAFHERVKKAITNFVTKHPTPVLIVCHGGIFRAIGALYGTSMTGTPNCVLHHFEPHPENTPMPWKIIKY